MKKFPLGYAICVVVVYACIAWACNNEKPKGQLSTRQHMKAEALTIENMLSAYEGELTATAKYEEFSKRAESDGYHNIAILYNAVSAAENIHSRNHLAVLNDAGAKIPIIKPKFEVKSTKENLKDDIDGEAFEAKTMYPQFLKTAEEANNQIAVLSLTYAMKTEQKHKFFFEQVLGDINSNALNSLPSHYFVCPACGNTYSTASPRHCDFSLTDGKQFLQFQ